MSSVLWISRTANTVTKHGAALVQPVLAPLDARSLVKNADQPISTGRVTNLNPEDIIIGAAVQHGWQSFFAEAQSRQIG